MIQIMNEKKWTIEEIDILGEVLILFISIKIYLQMVMYPLLIFYITQAICQAIHYLIPEE